MRLRNALMVLIFLLWMPRAFAGVIEETGHGKRGIGQMGKPGPPMGSCRQCHTGKSGVVNYPKGLGRENDNGLCFSCHQDEGLSGVYPRPDVYQTSNHGTNPRFIWPGPNPPARREPNAQGKCLNCHTPHGAKDRLGVIPSLLFTREDELCITCHGRGVAVTDIAREVRKIYSHVSARNTGRHHADENGNPARYSFTTGNRHAACSDCHNAHAVASDPLPPVPPLASARNARVSRVGVVNGVAGSIPTYVYRPASDVSTPVLEYEICFKCHSSWTQPPAGQQDMARLFNTNNASYHPVEGQGRNINIDPISFTAGHSSLNTIFCSDCHGSDDSSFRGPHGSRFPGLLKKNYPTRSLGGLITRDDLCFVCHNFDAYANQSGPVQQASRFNPPFTSAGHVFHAGQRSVPCYACHDSHGSPQFPALIITGRLPGIINFSVRADGGTCFPTCHGPQAYRINYPR